ncbi:chitinase [Aquincola sp. S2]|uniref:Chitinase n=1 Tax=Pseudaquabacterium terrae TaxID=2732868 RepID=A0ABX2EE53_9BURK|nr:chitinase [Aquabacterium terrae]NRF66889.1 chitinase [Aquabacterium terrae]
MKFPACLCALAAAAGLAGCGTPRSAAPDAAPFLPTPAQFERLFPERLPFYGYEGFAAAVRSMPGFASTGPEALRRREMAAFLGQIAHESDRLRALREYARENWDHYCRSGGGDSCAPGRQYYGRGPIQLSWNYQYRAAGQAIGVDLWSEPDLVATDPKIAWQTALWYWMTQPGPGRMTSHAAIVDGFGFGETTRSINGALECDKPADEAVQRKLARRIGFYREAAALFEVDVGERLAC